MKKSLTVLLFLNCLSLLNYAFANNKIALQNAEKMLQKSSWAFEENKGQVTGVDANNVKFVYKDGSLSMFLMQAGIAYQFHKVTYPEGYKALDKFASIEELEKMEKLQGQIKTETYRMDVILEGANPNPKIKTEGKSEDFIQYYNHNALDVRSYQKVTYCEVYPNIDWVVYINKNAGINEPKVKYDFIVHPGGAPSQIKLKTAWVEELTSNADGSITLNNRMGSITEQRPISFQEDKAVQTNFVVKNNIINFLLSNYDINKDIVIDPGVVWATYYGGSSIDQGNSCAIDGSGNVYLAGFTNSTINIASGGHQNTIGGSLEDAFLVKFNSAGVRQWATYYGGSMGERGYSCKLDGSGNVYLAGSTSSTNNIASGGHQNTKITLDDDAFLVKFNGAGVRQWATYYGGSGIDALGFCAVDGSGNVYLAGVTQSTNNIASGGHQNTLGGGQDAFLVKFNSAGVRQWATYYGGSGSDWISSVETNGSGNVYLAGNTRSTNSIASGGHQNTLNGHQNAFLVKFDSAGVRDWATYYGGSSTGGELGNSCATDGNGNVFLAGTTYSTNNIALGGHQNTFSGVRDAFLVKFDNAGVRQWATYYGGSVNDDGHSCATDNSGNVYLAGGTTSMNNIASGGHQNIIGGGQDAFLVKFNSAGVRQWATYYGVSTHENGNSCAVDGSGNVYLAGQTNSTTNIASGGHQNIIGGGQDAFLVKFNNAPPSNLITQDTIKACGDSVLVSATSGLTSYSWSNGKTTASFFAKSTGWYKVTATNSAGCPGTDSVFVSIVKANILNNDTSICLGRSVRLRADTISLNYTTGITCLEIQENNSGILQGPLGSIISNINFASYGTPTGSCNSYNISSCNAANSFSIVSNLCIGNNLCNLSATNSVFGDPCGGIYKRLYVSATYQIKSDKYLWSTGDTTPTINVTPTVTTKYWVRVSNGSHFCTDTVTVTVNQPPINLISQDTIKACGDSVIVSATSGMNTYSWSNGKTTASFFAKSTGWYKVTATNNVGCPGTDSVFVSIVKANILNNDTSICLGRSVRLSVDSSLVSIQSVCAITSNLNQQFNTWTLVSSIINCSDIIKKDTTIFLRTNNDVLKTNSLGSNWTSLNFNSQIGNSCPGGMLGFDWLNRVFVSTCHNSLYAFNGTTWTDMGLGGFGCGGNFIHRLANNRIIVMKAGFLRDLYISDNNGTTWTNVTNVDNDYWDMIVAPNGNIYSCGGSNTPSMTGLIRSTNNGSSFTQINSQLGITYCSGFSRDCSGSIYAVCDNKIYKSIDGNNWAIQCNIPSFFTINPGYSSLVIASNGDYYLWSYSTPSMVGFFKSTNLGQSWSQITSIPAANIRRVREIDGNIVAVTSQGTFALSLLKSNTYLWSTGDTTPTINVTPNITTKYWVRVSNGSHFCTDTVTVTVNQPPINLISQDTIKACGDSVLVSATLGMNTYSWSNGKTTASFFAKSTGWYKVTATNSSACSGTDSVFVSILKANILNNDTAICLGRSVRLRADSILGSTPLSSCAPLPTNLQNGLVGYWPFCGNANDLSGNNNHGTVNGATLTSDRFGNINSAYSFNGSSKINIPHSPSLSLLSDFSISSYIKLYTFSTPYNARIILSKHDGDTGICGYTFGIWKTPQDKINFQSNPNFNSSTYPNANGIIQDTNWKFLVVTYNKATSILKYFFNDILIDSISLSSDTKSNNLPLSIGGQSSLYGMYYGYFNGKLDDIAIWNRALNPQEIQQLYTPAYPQSYLWSTGDTTPTINVTPSVTTKYWVRVSNGSHFCTDTVTVTVNPKTFSTINQTICEGQNFLGRTTSGTYIDTLLGANSKGCDSIRKLNLTVNLKTFSTINQTICQGQSFLGRTISGLFIDTLVGANSKGCDSIRTLNLTVNLKTFSTINQTICQGQSFLGRTISGLFIDTLLGANSKGCDSIRTLNLTVNPKTFSTINQTICQGQSFLGRTISGLFIDTLVGANSKGCDSIRTLNLTVNPKTFSTINQAICQGQSFLGRTTSGTYIDTLLGANSKGCDSIRTLNLIVNPKTFSSINQTICQGQSFLGRTTSGTYTDTLVGANSKGCDSIRTLNLTVNLKTFSTINQTICQGQSFLGRITSGTYIDTLLGANSKGCDSIRTLNLTVNPKTFSTINQTICEGQSFLGRIISGIFIDTLAGANSKGCDSIRTLNLTVNPKTFSTINQTICEGQNFLGRTTSGTYIDTLIGANSKGCDSIRTLNLTVNPKTFSTINQTICQGQSFLGRTTSGMYTDTLVGANSKGCDSIRTLNLTVNPKTLSTINQTICEGQSFLGRTISGTYIDTLIGANSKGCDSIRTLNLTVNPKTLSTINQTICEGQSFLSRTTSGTFIDTLVGANSKGCDSIRTLNLTVNPKTLSTINQTICEGQSFLSRTTSGTFIDTLVGANSKGCDSIRTLNLTVNLKTFSTINKSICEGQSFLGRTTSGTYIDTLLGANSKGCDSIRTLNLTVNLKTFSTINQTICQGQSFLGRTISGMYIDTLVGANSKGCDSIRTLNLTVNPKTLSTITQTICEGQSFLGRTTSGTFIDTLVGANSKGCDSIRTLNLTVKPNSIEIFKNIICYGDTLMGRFKTGIYYDTFKGMAVNGCDSILILDLLVYDEDFSQLPNSIIECKSVKIIDLNKLFPNHIWYKDSFSLIKFEDLEIIEDSKRIYGIEYFDKCKSPIKKLDVIINKGEILIDKPEYCEGDTIVLNFNGNYKNLKWFNNDTSLATRSIAKIPMDIYVDFEFKEKKCRIDTNIKLKPKPNPPVVSEPITLDYQSTIEDINVIGENVTWYNDKSKNKNIDLQTIVIHQKPYFVSQTVDGCESDILTIKVLIDISKIMESIYINNSMSPNGDGILDAFTIDNIEKTHNTSVQIINRWGELVFESKNYKNNWYGVYLKEDFKGEILPDGVYYYSLEFDLIDYPERFKRSGYIYLKK